MREQILSLQVEVDREYGIMDIGKKVGFNVETRKFQEVEFPTHGYTVIAYNSPCLATVDFTPINRELPPERKIRTLDDLYDYFDLIHGISKLAGAQLLENTEDVPNIEETTHD